MNSVFWLLEVKWKTETEFVYLVAADQPWQDSTFKCARLQTDSCTSLRGSLGVTITQVLYFT